MEVFHDSLKCTKCKMVFEMPVLILPCGDSICQKHVVVETCSNATEYHCEACDFTHVIPSAGFLDQRNVARNTGKKRARTERAKIQVERLQESIHVVQIQPTRAQRG
jgi:hypothetical protein